MTRPQDHTLARELVQDALHRFAAPDQDQHEGDAQLIVMGAICSRTGTHTHL